jgi:hypothetical protein
MDTASKLLVLGGVLNLVYGLLTGIPASVIRSKQPTYSKYLRLVHVGALLWCPTLISLSVAVALSPLDATLELVAAGLMVAASVLLDAKDTLNWLMKVQDEFAEKPALPLLLGGLSSLASLVGAVILTIGVLQAL